MLEGNADLSKYACTQRNTFIQQHLQLADFLLAAEIFDAEMSDENDDSIKENKVDEVCWVTVFF